METPRAKTTELKPSDGPVLDNLRDQRARLTAALIAILAASACGGRPSEAEQSDAEQSDASVCVGTADGGEPACLCETPERRDAPAPRVDIQTDNIQLQENRLRIGFNVPEFDARCRAPFTVYARAMVWRNPEEVPVGEEPSEDPLSSQEQLPGETVVYGPGAYFLDAEFPPSAARISSVTLHVVDAAGEEFVTPPFSPLE